jgi:hypothetical protein
MKLPFGISVYFLTGMSDKVLYLERFTVGDDYPGDDPMVCQWTLSVWGFALLLQVPVRRYRKSWEFRVDRPVRSHFK